MTQEQKAPETIFAAAKELETSILRQLPSLPHPLPKAMFDLLTAVQQFNFEQRGL